MTGNKKPVLRFAPSLVPIAFGVVMGLAGLLGWGLNPEALTGFLG